MTTRPLIHEAIPMEGHAMRLRATCHSCSKDFLFFELYNAAHWDDSRCPRCQAHLGIPNARRLFLATDQAAIALLSSLNQIAEREPNFTLHAEPWLQRLAAVAAATERPAIQGNSGAPPPSVLQRFRRRAAA